MGFFNRKKRNDEYEEALETIESEETEGALPTDGEDGAAMLKESMDSLFSEYTGEVDASDAED